MPTPGSAHAAADASLRVIENSEMGDRIEPKHLIGFLRNTQQSACCPRCQPPRHPIAAAPPPGPSSPWTANQYTWAEEMLGPGPEPLPDSFPTPSPRPPGWPPPDYDAMRDATGRLTEPIDWTAQDTAEIG